MKLSVLTPEGAFLEAQVYSVVVPAIDGLLGILKDHAPLLAALTKGVVKIQSESGAIKINVGPGLVEVNDNSIIILTDSAKKQ